jgi:hypothetical protein
MTEPAQTAAPKQSRSRKLHHGARLRLDDRSIAQELAAAACAVPCHIRATVSPYETSIGRWGLASNGAVRWLTFK